ncbi:DUF1824 family protein [Synechocystis sp. PCC 6714]|uniref:DUF1824 family protein n=1 Tax=Synechocystis sp. (strain PCC 6714) TaxID=1147 RepID=UPI0004D190EB|nr:DUF1824 family protein [Synechocystis sp. PCC 6714]AIE73461.1 hypothetical protein D082_09330 [Synechocystis sp. PCC 6714]
MVTWAVGNFSEQFGSFAMDASPQLALLKDYSRLEIRIPQNEEERENLRQAIVWICGQSEAENFGICADDQASAENALGQYLRALGYGEAHRKADLCEIAMEPGKAIEGPVYLKCNSQSLRFYLDSYDGNYRGVLISCQTEEDTLAGTYGYFPLDLFAI